MKPARLVLTAFFQSALLGLVLCGCDPGEDSAGGDKVSRDPTGIAIPLLKQAPPAPAAKTAVLCLANANDPFQRVQADLFSVLTRSSAGFGAAYRDAAGDAEAQARQLAALADSPPAVVLIVPVDAAAISPALRPLRAAGTIIIGLDGRFADGDCDSIVWSDLKKTGKLAGEIAVSALRLKARDEGAAEPAGRIVQLQGAETEAGSKAKNEGFLEALKSNPSAILVHDAPAGLSKKDAIERIREAVRLQKTFDIVYAQNDLMAQGASEALIEAKMRETVLIIGSDGVPAPGAGIEMLNKGQIDATVHQPLLIDLAWKAASRMLSDKQFKPKPRYEIEPIAVTPKTLPDFQRRGIVLPEL